MSKEINHFSSKDFKINWKITTTTTTVWAIDRHALKKEGLALRNLVPQNFNDRSNRSGQKSQCWGYKKDPTMQTKSFKI